MRENFTMEELTEMKLEMQNVFLEVRQVDIVKNFFIQKLGFHERADREYSRMGWTALHAPAKQYTVILSEQEESQTPKARTPIIINTEDCLKDYYFLKQEQVEFLTEPRYLSIGLAADFADAAGNRYMLLEERRYSKNYKQRV